MLKVVAFFLALFLMYVLCKRIDKYPSPTDEYFYYGFDWSKFNYEQFIYTAMVCAAILSIGIFIKYDPYDDIVEWIGIIIIVIGCIGTLIVFFSPTIGAIRTIFPVAIGFGIIFYPFYLIYHDLSKDHNADNYKPFKLNDED